MYLLGINAYHGDSSAAIYKGGELIVATEEERFRRIKHWAGLPTMAIKFCLDEAGITLADVDHICISRDPKAKLLNKAWYALTSGVSIANLKSRMRNTFNIRTLKEDLCSALEVPPASVKAQVRFIEHHRAHIASAFHASPFEECAILSIDGMGDFSSTMRATGRDTQIKVLDSKSYPHSLGMFYTAFTQYLGFPHYGDEYKLMGLAPYGKPIYADKIMGKVISMQRDGLFELHKNYFLHFTEGVAMSWDNGSPEVGRMYSNALVREFGPAREKGEEINEYHKDLAASVQEVTEQIIFHMAEDLRRKTQTTHLC